MQTQFDPATDPVTALSSRSDEPMLRAQHHSLTRLVPVLYTAVIIATLAIVFAFVQTSPSWLVIWLPGMILVIIAVRMRYWIRARGTSETSHLKTIRNDIRSTLILGPGIAFGFAMVGIAMLHYGNTYQQSLVGVSIWITAVASAFCLAALPAASITIVICAAAPLAFSFLTSGNDVMIVLSGVVAVISLQVIYMLVLNYKSFSEMVESRQELQKRNELAEQAKEDATKLAYTDHLTGLSNRRHFELLLKERVSTQKDDFKPFTVGVIDLDGFKPINDMFGHGVGDDVLIEAATRLSDRLEGHGVVARVGGDEFAFLLDTISDKEAALDFARNLLATVSEPYDIANEHVAQMTGSAGLAIQSAATSDPERLLDQADIALYRSKSIERGSACLFTDDLESSALQQASIEQGLRRAIDKKAFTVHFQPILDLRADKLTGFESLARWHDEELGHVSPAIFIPIAERLGLIEELTDDLLRQAATTAASWPAHLMLSFNLSAEQLVKDNAADRIIALLHECGLPLERFEAEVTETAVMKDLAAAQRTIAALKFAGARVSLDDFGTGYSSLSQIRNLPLDKVKVDKSFVDELCKDDKMRNLVGSIIKMCETLELRCVAEGIEHPDQLAALKSVGCHGGQGYLFSRPGSKEDTERIIAEDAGKMAA